MSVITTKQRINSSLRNKVKSESKTVCSPVNRSQQSKIHNILHSTGAQAKLTIGEPSDKYEQEADRVADQVMRMSDADVAQRVESGTVQLMSIQRLEAGEEESEVQSKFANDTIQRQEDDEEQLQAKEPPGQSPKVSSGTESRINSLKGGGQPLDMTTRGYFEPRFGHDFSDVRVHSDNTAADTAKSINARAFTLGNHIVMGSGEYQAGSCSGKRLLGHELTHVVQQRAANSYAAESPSFLPDPGVDIQRDIAEEEISNTPVEQIMADDKYFENGITTIDFYGAELAILHFGDGSEIRLGLVPDYISEPFAAVDYRTPSSAHIPVTTSAPSLGKGSISFLPRGAEAEFPDDFTYGELPEVVEQFGRTINFTHHDNGYIVPTEVNDISAPRLSKVLREAEAEYVRRFDEAAAGAIETLEMLEWVIILASLVEAPVAAVGSRGTVAVGTAVKAESTLTKFFSRLLGSGASEAITVEGVGFAGVRVATRGTELTVTRSVIVNASKISGQGRLIHAAFEKAAIEAARQSGAKTARVALELVQNRSWAAYLESQGYVFQLIAKEGGGWTNVLTKVFTL